MKRKDLISIHELSSAEVGVFLSRAADIKARPHDYRSALPGKILAMIFEKSSTRTRVSFHHVHEAQVAPLLESCTGDPSLEVASPSPTPRASSPGT